MTQPPFAADPPVRSSTTVGVTILLVLILGVAAWMFTQRPTGSAVPFGATSPPAALPSELPGFRPDAWFLPDDGLLGFVEVTGGPFLMGGDPTTDPASFENERWSPVSAQGTVELPTFYLGRYEVTVAQFAAFVQSTGFEVSNETLQGEPAHPVSAVSRPDAIAYTRWLDTTHRE